MKNLLHAILFVAIVGLNLNAQNSKIQLIFFKKTIKPLYSHLRQIVLSSLRWLSNWEKWWLFDESSGFE